MSLSPKEFKQRFLDAVACKGEYFRQVNSIQYQTRCPFCGDSSTNLNTGHLYLRCDLSDNYPIVYNCFKCPAHGRVTMDTLEKFGITDEDLLSSVTDVNGKYANIKGMTYNKSKDDFRDFSYSCPVPRMNCWKIQYVERRLGIEFTDEMIQDCKIITSLKEFLDFNGITSITCGTGIAQLLEDHYIGFLSYGNSHILFRDVTEKEKISWVKYPITKASQGNVVCYSIASAIDVFGKGDIIVNLCEGVLDIISIKYNLGYDYENCINMCVTGKSYKRIINRIITMGIIGRNVTLNIFSDNDKKFNDKKNNKDTHLWFYKKELHKYGLLFKEINVYYNTAYKDCGVSKDKIRLSKHRL